MSNQKTLKIKRVFAYTIYSNLRNTPPKDYPTTGEIKSTISVILPALKEHISDYLGTAKKAGEIAEETMSKKITQEESDKKVEELNVIFRQYNKEHAGDIVEISLDEEGFNTLKTQFDRENWGKKWVANIEEFGELNDAFTEAGK
mgnify:CR=1 FL=1